MSLSLEGQSRPLIALACLALIAAGAGCKSSKKSSTGMDAGPSSGGSGGKGSSGGSGGKGTSGSGGSSGKGGSSGGGGSGGAGACPSNAGGPTPGPTDMHCIDSSGNPIKQATNESACQPPADAAIPSDDGGTSDYGDTMYGMEADDDDCKYHLKWTASCIEENQNVTFNVTVTKTVDGTPLTKALPDLEVFLSDTHTAPNTDQKPKETAPGVYTAGPIKFDAPGKWTVRFHLREECVDLTPDSPHGHAAFYVDVP